MAKDLPYFKFYVSEWMGGRITLLSYEAQGIFINLCALYWNQSGCVRIADAKRRHSGRNAVAWKELISEGIIKIRGDSIIIKFLDEQILDRKNLSKKNSQNALERWKNDATALPSHSDRIEVAMPIEEKRREENIQRLLDDSLDAVFISKISPGWAHINFELELREFREKVFSDPLSYQTRDTGGIKKAFLYQLRNAKHKPKDKSGSEFDEKEVLKRIKNQQPQKTDGVGSATSKPGSLE